MSVVALHLDAYEWDTDLGPDDLSDVDLSHPSFLAAFPDGKVPIRHVPQPRAGMGDGFFAWAENVLAIHDATAHLDVDRLSELRDLVTNWTPDDSNDYQRVGDLVAASSERKGWIAEMMRLGLTLRVIARYLAVSEQWVLDALTQEKCTLDARSVFDADELVVDGMSARAAARECGFPEGGAWPRIQKLRRHLTTVSPRSDDE